MFVNCNILYHTLRSSNVISTLLGVRHHGVDEVYNSDYLRVISFQLETKIMKNSFINDLWRFLFSKSSRLVLIPFIFILLVFAFIFVVAEGTAWAPFVYAIF